MKMFRVTEIISPYVNFNHVSLERLQAAADRGTEIHAYLNAYLNDLFLPVPENAKGYCESGARWIDQNVKRVISSEREYRDEVLGYYGHPDAVVELRTGKFWVPDWKSPVVASKSWPLQIAGGYHHLICKAHRYKRENVIPGALMLSPTGGTAKMVRYDREQPYYFSIFLGLLNAAKYFDKEGDK